MKPSFILAACAAACLVTVPALAEQPFSTTLAPTLTLGLQFGEAAAARTPVRFNAQLDIRSSLLRAVLPRELSTSNRPAEFTTLWNAMPSLPVLELQGDRLGFDAARMLGHEIVGASDR